MGEILILVATVVALYPEADSTEGAIAMALDDGVLTDAEVAKIRQAQRIYNFAFG